MIKVYIASKDYGCNECRDIIKVGNEIFYDDEVTTPVRFCSETCYEKYYDPVVNDSDDDDPLMEDL